MAHCGAALYDNEFVEQMDAVKDLADNLRLLVNGLEPRSAYNQGIYLALGTTQDKAEIGGTVMKQVDVVLVGADKLSKQLDEIDDLVVKLRRALAGLDEQRMHLEMQFNGKQPVEVKMEVGAID